MKAVRMAILSTVFFLCFSVEGHTEPHQQIKKLGQYGLWNVCQVTNSNVKYCYMYTPPLLCEGSYHKRGPVYLMISHVPQRSIYNVIEYLSGYPYHTHKEVLAFIDGRKHVLFADGERAWCAPDTVSDKSLIKDILHSTGKLIVQGTSRRGVVTKDTYSLNGALHAYKKMCQACQLERHKDNVLVGGASKVF